MSELFELKANRRKVPSRILPFPSSGGVLEAFLQRIRFSPKETIDRDWLVNCLGISQATNAGRTLLWLRTAGIIDAAGLLTQLGLDLQEDAEPKQRVASALAALYHVLPPSEFLQLKNGELSRERLRQQLCTDYDVKPNTANKALVGMYVLAELAEESEIVSALGSSDYRPHNPRYRAFDLEASKKEILQTFSLFTGGTGGIDGWLNESTPAVTFERLNKIPVSPMSSEQLNQLLTLGQSPPLSRGFFRYYWLTVPSHTYDILSVPCFSRSWEGSLAIFHLDQLYWGLYRFYVDALLFFGNVRSAYQHLRTMTESEIVEFFDHHRVDTNQLITRGPALDLNEIKRDDRYLISEMACKSYAPSDDEGVGIETALIEACNDHFAKSADPITAGDLLGDKGDYLLRTYPDKQAMFKFAAGEILDDVIHSPEDLRNRLSEIKARFLAARDSALVNTDRYLSSVGELDVYVATSMRSRGDFHGVTDLCASIFGDRRLRRYNARYFDPTLSAAENHEDKGIIECLMVKCAKALVYTAGDRESFGKDAEAAMALSLGKPVIFFCSSSERQAFYREVHPLTRLMSFQTGVAVGAMVTDNERDIVTLLDRLFSNTMQYRLRVKRPGYLVLEESLTGCVVRLQTSDQLLRETFWNHYHGSRPNVDYSGN